MQSTRRLVGAAIPAAVLAAVLLGCGAPSSTDINFWDGISAAGLEVDPPEDLAELASRSPTIVTGSVGAVEEVPPEISGLPDEAPVVAVTIDIADVVRSEGVIGNSIAIVRPRDPAVTIDDLEQALQDVTSLPVMFFLEPAGYGNFYATVSDLGAIAQTGENSLATVFDPSLSSNVIPASVSSLEEIEARVR